jgi:hypothetical protein
MPPALPTTITPDSQALPGGAAGRPKRWNWLLAPALLWAGALLTEGVYKLRVV